LIPGVSGADRPSRKRSLGGRCRSSVATWRFSVHRNASRNFWSVHNQNQRFADTFQNQAREFPHPQQKGCRSVRPWRCLSNSRRYDLSYGTEDVIPAAGFLYRRGEIVTPISSSCWTESSKFSLKDPTANAMSSQGPGSRVPSLPRSGGCARSGWKGLDAGRSGPGSRSPTTAFFKRFWAAQRRAPLRCATFF